MTNKDKNRFKILNFGQTHYYPQGEITKDLEKVIIFTENTSKNNVPNGSVFIYNIKKDKEDQIIYNPDILKSDIGCGIGSIITDKLDLDNYKVREDILKAVNEIGIHIGQGNHFLDFTTTHPVLRKEGIESSMVYLHSDFNNDEIIPTTFDEAKVLENNAKDKRREYLDKLGKILDLDFKFYNDWTHNSVNVEDDKLIYRKGAINLKETDGIGVLALNPVEGLYLYAGKFDEYNSSMQHGLGRVGSKGELQKLLTKENQGMARGYVVSAKTLTKEIENMAREVYNPIHTFMSAFGDKQYQIGNCSPKYVVTTKKSGNQ